MFWEVIVRALISWIPSVPINWSLHKYQMLSLLTIGSTHKRLVRYTYENLFTTILISLNSLHDADEAKQLPIV